MAAPAGSSMAVEGGGGSWPSAIRMPKTPAVMAATIAGSSKRPDIAVLVARAGAGPPVGLFIECGLAIADLLGRGARCSRYWVVNWNSA